MLAVSAIIIMHERGGAGRSVGHWCTSTSIELNGNAVKLSWCQCLPVSGTRYQAPLCPEYGARAVPVIVLAYLALSSGTGSIMEGFKGCLLKGSAFTNRGKARIRISWKSGGVVSAMQH